MILTTPFHERTAALNQTRLWELWSNHLAARRYQLSDKAEYFAVRDSAGIFDTSPLFKYRVSGPDAERFLAGMLARDVRACEVGQAQYTCWLDERGTVVEDGVVLHTAPEEYLLTSAEPNLAWFGDRTGRLDVRLEDVSDAYGVLALQGPRSRELLARLVPAAAELPYFGVTAGEIAGSAVTVSRTGFTGDLGYEVWVAAPDALPVWDALWESVRGYGVLPFGLDALQMLRIEAGLLPSGRRLRLQPVRLERRPPLHPHRARLELDVPRPRVRRPRLHRPPGAGARAGGADLALGNARPRRGLGGPRPRLRRGRPAAAQGPHPVLEDWMVYAEGDRAAADDRGGAQAGYATGFMYSPVLQRHIAIARVRPDLAESRNAGQARVHREPSLRAGHRARRASAPLQPRAKDGVR